MFLIFFFTVRKYIYVVTFTQPPPHLLITSYTHETKQKELNHKHILIPQPQ
jgi:hypothetical protein